MNVLILSFLVTNKLYWLRLDYVNVFDILNSIGFEVASDDRLSCVLMFLLVLGIHIHCPASTFLSTSNEITPGAPSSHVS